jgi:hypothetical protein
MRTNIRIDTKFGLSNNMKLKKCEDEVEKENYIHLKLKTEIYTKLNESTD